jgi:Predicted flavin-nucleotide-binding protein
MRRFFLFSTLQKTAFWLSWEKMVIPMPFHSVFVYDEEKIYIHGLKEGHKVDSLIANPKVSFCIIADAQVNPAGFTVMYTSIIIFGTARQLDGDEKRTAIERVIRKYSAEHWDKGQKVIQAMWDKFAAFEITIDHMTGKQTI